MGRNLTNLYISSSFQFLTQVSGSELQDGLGNKITGSLEITASLANTATTASYVLNAVSASFATTAISSSFATTAISSSVSNTAISASYANTAGTADVSTEVVVVTDNTNSTRYVSFTDVLTGTDSQRVDTGLTYVPFTNTLSTTNVNATTFTGDLIGTASFATNVISASFATSASLAQNAISSSFATNATSASFATNALSSSYAISSSQAQNAVTASFALNVTPLNTGSLLVTASISNATTTFTKGDGSTFSITANNVVNANSASVATSASFATQAQNAVTATTATTASYVLNAVSSSFASTASFYGGSVTSASYAASASVAVISNSATSASFASTSSFTPNAVVTASVSSNTITFTKGDTSTFNVTVGTGSAVAFPYTGSALITGSLGVTGSIAAGNNVSATNATSFAFGDGNTASGTTTFVAGRESSATQIGSAVIGGVYASNGGVHSTIAGGQNNTISGGERQFIGGGQGNTTSADRATIVGGSSNTNSGVSAGIIGGNGNNVTAVYSVIAGGNSNNDNTGGFSFIGGGNQNILDGSNSSQNYSIGGAYSRAQGINSGVLGGWGSYIYDDGNTSDPYRRSNTIVGSPYSEIGISSNTGRNFAGIYTSLYSYIRGTSASPSLRNVIIGSSGSLIPSGSTGRIIIGGENVTASVDNTVYVPNLNVSGSITAPNATTFVQNTADTYTSSAAVQQVVTLTQAEYNAIGSPNANTLYIISGSAANATLGANTFVGNQVISGSLRGNVVSGSINSSTASLDFSTGNFFTLNTSNVLNTYILPTNVQSGQTVNLELTYPTTASAITFPSFVKQASGSAYVPSGANKTDILTFIVFNSGSVYLSNVKNLV
jgi:hypothetical protein